MNFESLIKTAAKNAEHLDKKVESIKKEAEEARRRELQRIEHEKMEKHRQMQKMKEQRPKREPTPEKKFVIPKKKSTEPTVSQDQVARFLAKKEEEKKAAEKQKLADKDKLIQLRMQNNGGKANNKMAKHFGIDPISMQIRYGNDHSHIEKLQKQKWREEEELDIISTQFRSGVYKAKQEMGKKLQEASSSGIKKEPHRMATSKANSLAGLSSRHAATRDHFSPPKETKKEDPKPVLEKKKRPTAPPVSFDALMRVATDKTAGKNVDLSVLGPTPSKVPKINRDRPDSKEVNINSLPQRGSSSSSHNSTFKKPSASSNSVHRPSIDSKHNSSSSMKKTSNSSKMSDSNIKSSSSKIDTPILKTNEKIKEKKDAKGRFIKAPTPPPVIPTAVLGKRYLPGDIRYKQQQEMMKAAGIKPETSSRPSSNSYSSLTSSRKMDSNHITSREQKIMRGVPEGRSSSSNSYNASSNRQRPETSQSSRQSKDQLSREERDRRRRAMERKQYERRRYEDMSLVERERDRERKKMMTEYGIDSEEEEEEDEYDSEMDDFIDDSLDIDEFSQKDFEETLRMVNPKYNKKMWKYREQTISERGMEADYRSVQKEEARSAKLGFLEDVYEAKKHKSVAL